MCAVLMGLSVAFPVDYRYGWDISNPQHQHMLLEAQEYLRPDVVVVAPDCAPWSVSANRLTEEDREQVRESQSPTLAFVKTLLQRQHREGRGFILEQPWSSAMWKKSMMSQLQHELPGCRPRQRTDQCCFGAQDEQGRPIMKPTGLQANFSLRQSSRRCQGHAQGHGQLQSSYQGVSRTASAAVYPHLLCRAIVKDIMKYISSGRSSTMISFFGYKCEKCALGRNAPPGLEHTFIPKECRHASKFKEPEASSAPASSSSAPSGVNPGLPVRAVVNTPMPQLLEEYQQKAMKSKNLDQIRIQFPDTFPELPAVHSVMLKQLLTDLISDSVNILSEHKGQHNHWSQDPLHLALLRKILGKMMLVRGVCVSLHAEVYPQPMPFLRTESAPLRMIIRGDVASWTVKTLEDLRTFSSKQLNNKIYCEDWIVAIFGSAPKDQDYWEINRARGIVTRHHLQPRITLFAPNEAEGPVSIEELQTSRVTTAISHDRPGPKIIIRDEWTSRDSSRAALEGGRWTGSTEFQLVPQEDDERPEVDPVLRKAAVDGQELDTQEASQEAPEEEIEDAPTIQPPMKANFDFRRVLVRLPKLAKDDVAQARRLLLGLHELARRCWGPPEHPHADWHAGRGNQAGSRSGSTMFCVPQVQPAEAPSDGEIVAGNSLQ